MYILDGWNDYETSLSLEYQESKTFIACVVKSISSVV